MFKSQSVSQCSSRPRAHHTSGTIILGLGKGWGSNSKCTRFALYTRALPLGPVCGLRFRFGRPLDERLGTRTVSRDGSAPLGQHKCTEYSRARATQFRALVTIRIASMVDPSTSGRAAGRRRGDDASKIIGVGGSRPERRDPHSLQTRSVPPAVWVRTSPFPPRPPPVYTL